MAFEWLPWAQDPDVAYAYTLPSGRECETRLLVYETEPTGRENEVRAHFRSIDAVALADIDGALTEVRAREGQTMVAVTSAGVLEDVPRSPEGPTEDDLYAAAADQALPYLLKSEANAIVLDYWSTDVQTQCEGSTP